MNWPYGEGVICSMKYLYKHMQYFKLNAVRILTSLSVVQQLTHNFYCYIIVIGFTINTNDYSTKINKYINTSIKKQRFNTCIK